jgi:hypothetical protein
LAATSATAATSAATAAAFRPFARRAACPFLGCAMRLLRLLWWTRALFAARLSRLWAAMFRPRPMMAAAARRLAATVTLMRMAREPLRFTAFLRCLFAAEEGAEETFENTIGFLGRRRGGGMRQRANHGFLRRGHIGRRQARFLLLLDHLNVIARDI